MSPPAAIGGVVMGLAAFACFVAGLGVSGAPQVSQDVVERATALRSDLKVAQAKIDALPTAKDAGRGLDEAQSAAAEVARFQNEYRALTPAVAAAEGTLDDSQASSIRRNLIPYFAPDTDRASLLPWYLLAADKDVKAGASVPMSFRSGFEWTALQPHLVTDSATIRVTWHALQNFAPGDAPRPILAWARADFDLRTKTFSNIQTGSTAVGEALRQEVAQ